MAELKTREVEVTVHLDFNHKPEFYFTTNLPTKPGKKDNLIFKKGGPDGFTVRYHLADDLYTFGTDPKEALYSSKNPVCPVPKGHWDEFVPIAIEQNGRTLVVHNKNESIQEFGYMLRVIKKGGSYRDLDPVGTNQNGNSSAFSSMLAVMVAVGAGVAGFVAAKAALPLASDGVVLAVAASVALVVLGIYFLAQKRLPRTA